MEIIREESKRKGKMVLLEKEKNISEVLRK